MDFSFIIQVDTLCHKLPNFIDKCRRAGVKRVFIGLENINPDNLIAAKKKQNKITEYRKMLLDWQKAGVLTYAGFITGFPGDTAETILRDVEIIKKELPIDVLEFFYLTPLPGSEDHQKMFRAGHLDGSRPQQVRPLPHHRRSTRDVATRSGPTPITRRGSATTRSTTARRSCGAPARCGRSATRCSRVTWFKGCIEIEDVHPVEGGLFRIKDRRNRRPTMPMEPAWMFYPKYLRRGRGEDGALGVALSAPAQDLSRHQVRSRRATSTPTSRSRR